MEDPGEHKIKWQSSIPPAENDDDPQAPDISAVTSNIRPIPKGWEVLRPSGEHWRTPVHDEVLAGGWLRIAIMLGDAGPDVLTVMDRNFMTPIHLCPLENMRKLAKAVLEADESLIIGTHANIMIDGKPFGCWLTDALCKRSTPLAAFYRLARAGEIIALKALIKEYGEFNGHWADVIYCPEKYQSWESKLLVIRACNPLVRCANYMSTSAYARQNRMDWQILVEMREGLDPAFLKACEC